jgi:phospholipid-transporting ATPase
MTRRIEPAPDEFPLTNIADSAADLLSTLSGSWASINVLRPNPLYPGQVMNTIRTTRYTPITFIPLTLFENFRILSNVYFLIIVVICFLPWSPIGWFFQVLPLVFVITMSMIKSAVEDVMKYAEDQRRNNQPVEVYRDGEWQQVVSAALQVGDIICIHEGELIPSDVLYVGSSSLTKVCYYSETSLNGETAVKTMTCFSPFQDDDVIAAVTNHDYVIDVGAPDRDLTRFDARLRCGNDFWPISIRNVLLRGACVHYTKNVLGIVLRTGHDSKIMRNMRHPPAKLTSFDLFLNRLLIYVFIVNMVICLTSTGIGVSRERTAGFAYLDRVYPSFAESFAQFFIQYFVLYSYLIPISLNVTIEMLRLFHKVLLTWDPYFHDPEFGHANAHNSNQIGQLGLVTDVLSDKTGTLTENAMEILRFATDEGQYHADKFLKQLAQLRDVNLSFLLALALCNNVIVHKRDDGTVEYNAVSPDEAAFVNFAAKCGVRLLERWPLSVTVDVCGRPKTYALLAHLPFSSERRRMSVLLKADDEPAVLFCKGADSVISELSVHFAFNTTVNAYAKLGLRTLVFARRVIADDELDAWLSAFRADEAALVDRDRRIGERADEIERRLDVLGVSGVEDRLQPLVPEAIVWLRRAGIKIWILTGDKLETAVAIGKTSGVIQPQSDVVVIAAQGRAEVLQRLEVIRANIASMRVPVLVVTGGAVELCFGDWFEDFIGIADQMSAVVLCRVSPFMKAQIASAVRDRGRMTLAIGDGANDVGMIQVAHVGVGVYGREGSQAAYSSDFAIPRFRDLVRLLTVHGHWTYNRFSTVAVIMLYKNFVFILNQFWFSFDALWSPTSLYTDFFLSLFNLVFTVVPPFAFGGFNQDLPQEVLLLNPELYPVVDDWMRGRNLGLVILLAIYQSVVTYYSVRFTMMDHSLEAAGLMCYLTIVFIVIIQIMCWTSSLNVITLPAYIANVLAVPMVCFIYMGMVDMKMRGVLTGDLAHFYPWLGMLIAIGAAILPEFVLRTMMNRISPSQGRLWAERVRFEQAENPRVRKDSDEAKWTSIAFPAEHT